MQRILTKRGDRRQRKDGHRVSTQPTPPDLNFLFARVIATRLRSGVPVHEDTSQNTAPTSPPTTTSPAPPVPPVVSPPPAMTADQLAPSVNTNDDNVERPTSNQRAFK
eukprot:613285-Pleurochrysis_carterae.AAC.1